MYGIDAWSHLQSFQEYLLSTWGSPLVVRAQDWGVWDMPMMRGGWGIVMMLMMLVFWAAIVVVIIVGVRWLLTSSRSGRQTTLEHEAESALDVLKQRYARGEISKQVFEDMRRDIE